MMERSEQVRPLATVAKNRRRRCLRCCTCVGAALLIQAAVVVIILIFTVFKVKNPVFRLNGVTVDRLKLINGTTTPWPGTNVSLTADVSVKNPNYASFRYGNTTTALFYRGTAIGEARGPGGRSRARRTMRMNITVDVIADRLSRVMPDLGSDIKSGLVTFCAYTEIGGKAKLLMMKKHARVRLNCTLTINITILAIQDQKCKRKFKL